MYGGELMDDSTFGPSAANDDYDSSSDTSPSENEIESFLYSQIHYHSDDTEKNSPMRNPPQNEKKDDVIVVSESEQSESSTNATTQNGARPPRFVEKTLSCSSVSEAESLDVPVHLQFNTGASLLLSGKKGFNHPLMSVRQQYSRYNNNYSAKKRYFESEKASGDFQPGKVSALLAALSENATNTEFQFHCYLCGEASHLSKMCHLRLNEQRSRRNFNSFNEQDVCSTCGRKDHHPRSWLIRGPPRLVCPNLRCSSCGDLGHKLTDCADYENFRGRVCRRCGIPGHLEEACPDLWRMFHATQERIGTSADAVSTKCAITINERRYCYVCGRKGHFGFECLWEFRPSTARFLKSPFISTYTTIDGESVSEENEDQNDPILIEDDEQPDYNNSPRSKPFHGKRLKSDDSYRSGRKWQHNHREKYARKDGPNYSRFQTRDEIRRQNRPRKWHAEEANNNWQSERFRGAKLLKHRQRAPKSPKTRERMRRKITFA